MRSQYIKSLQQFCERRTRSSSVIRWWFSDSEIPPCRAGANEFKDEQTLPYGREADVETLEDPPLEDDFFHQLGYG